MRKNLLIIVQRGVFTDEEIDKLLQFLFIRNYDSIVLHSYHQPDFRIFDLDTLGQANFEEIKSLILEYKAT